MTEKVKSIKSATFLTFTVCPSYQDSYNLNDADKRAYKSPLDDGPWQRNLSIVSHNITSVIDAVIIRHCLHLNFVVKDWNSFYIKTRWR